MNPRSAVSTNFGAGSPRPQGAASCLPERLAFVLQYLVAVQQGIQPATTISCLATTSAAAIALPRRNSPPSSGQMRPYQRIGLLPPCRAGPGAVVEAIS